VLVLALAPALVLLFQSYGGEGPLRVYLFALPWLGFLCAAACMPRPGAGKLGAWRMVAATVAIGTCSLFGLFGQEPLNYVTPDDVAVSRWTLDNTPAGASFTLAAPNYPERADARYADHLDEIRDLLQVPGFAAYLSGKTARMPDIEAFIRRDRGDARYLILSPSQELYLRYHAAATTAGYARLRRALLASPQLRLVYRHGGGMVFAVAPRLAPPASLDRSPAGA
jgi:hypothetical protein